MATKYFPTVLKVGAEQTLGDEADPDQPFGYKLTALPGGNFLASWIDMAVPDLQLQVLHAHGHRLGPQISVAPPEGRSFSDMYDLAIEEDGTLWIAASQPRNETTEYLLSVGAVALSDLSGAPTDALTPSWFLADARPDGAQFGPSIDVLNGGGAAVIWTENQGQSNVVKLNIFNTPEETRTGALDVNNLFPSLGLFNTSVTALAGGGFVALWDGVSLTGGRQTVNFQMYTEAGIKIDTPLNVPAPTDIAPFDGSVAALAGGGFVVVWQSGDPEGGLSDIRFTVFDEAGRARPDMQVLAHPENFGIQSNPTVVATDDGGFIIGWTDQSGTRDDPGTGSFAREFHASGIPVDEPFLLNTSTIGDQTAPQLAFNEGRLAAVWNSFSDSAAVLVDSPFFQIFDMPDETVTQGMPDGFTPPGWRSQITLDDGSFVTMRAIPNPGRGSDWYLEHRDPDGEILYSQQVNNTHNTPNLVLNADGIISIFGTFFLEQSSGRMSSTVFYDPSSLSILPPIQLEGLRIPSDKDIFHDALIRTFSDMATVRIDGRQFGVFKATSSLFESDTHIQEIAQDGQPVGRAIGLPVPPEAIQAVFATEDGKIVLFVPGMDDNPTGYLTLSPPVNRPPVAPDPTLSIDADSTLMLDMLFEDPDGDTLSFTLPDAPTGTRIDDVGQLVLPSGFAGVLTVRAHDDAGATTDAEIEIVGKDPSPIIGTDGQDDLSGTQGDDMIEGRAGPDTLSGEAGNDSLSGGAGDDFITGGIGNDLLEGGDGADTLNGGEGEDTILGGATEADLRDVVFAGEGDDFVDGGYGNDELNGMGGNDTMEGGFGVDRLVGGEGDDVLNGGAFSDQIFGGDGFDFINGGFGSDRVNGGAGGDRFFHVGSFGHGSDWIQDYNTAEGDVLVYGGAAGPANFQVNITNTAGAGDAAVAEAFVIWKPTGQILWALVDGGGQDEINLRLGGVEYDLLA